MADRISITSGEELEAWLQDKPRDWAQVIASRVALRVLPLLEAALYVMSPGSGLGQQNMMIAFRANHISWAIHKYQARNVARSAVDAADAVDADAGYIAFAAYPAAEATNAARFAAKAAGGVAADVALYASTAAKHASNAATRTADDPSGGDVIWNSITSDAASLIRGMASVELIEQPLRLDDAGRILSGRSKIPEWARTPFDPRANGNSLRRAGFGIWIDWYRALLPNSMTALPSSYFGEKIDLRIVDQPDAWWNREPAEINAEITGWMEEREPTPHGYQQEATDVDSAELLAQRPAAHQFSEAGGLIVAEAIKGRLDPTSFGEGIWREVLGKAEALRSRLERTQAPDHVKDTINRLIATLGGSLSDVAPGVLLMRSRSLEADIATYNTPETRSELLADAQSLMRDLGASLEDLRALFPEIMEIEAARLAQRVAEGSASKALLDAREIISVARDSEVVDGSAIEALETPLPDIGEIDIIIAESTSDIVVADAIKSRAKLIALHLLDVRNFVASVLKSAKATSVSGSHAAAKIAKTAGRDVGERVYKGALDGVEETTKGAVKLSFIWLAGKLAPHLVALALLSLLFSGLARKAEETKQQLDHEPDDPVDA